ncbi:putative lipid II flippase FtsW [Marinimicrobium alkaliphilum]|uniref:putative lipid II flippase FtsW n=1 Tax=Marinimicrobium alkaliphilum TaxID=2202654 RepID=UPI001E55FBA3|nr:putative lipid II flippase FtsW [Marinimicrobium alkaliphilum]
MVRSLFDKAMAFVTEQRELLLSGPDRILLLITLALISIGLVMVASASVSSAALHYGDAWFFTKRHITYAVMGLSLAFLVLLVPMQLWQRYSGWLLIFSLIFLVLVLIPGIGREVNGSRRWISIGMFNVQVSEIAKFGAVIFFAGYFMRRQHLLSYFSQGFFKPVVVLCLMVLLLILEPDFGSAVVLCATVGAIMFIAGVRLHHLLLLGIGGGGAMLALAYAQPYRLRRLLSVSDPWADQFGSGYQLTQSLIAFGRGEWSGMGLGNSLQKLFFLPEAHTDFIFAIIAEEFGLLGALLVIVLFSVLIWRMFMIARESIRADRLFSGFAAFGVAILFTFQVFINIGVASGLLPTTGLTLPFISYGGSSLLISCLSMAFVMRVELELRAAHVASVQRPPRVRRELSLMPEVAQ